MKPMKPWLSFNDQLAQLESRGLQVEDRAAALDYLERLGYYRLSGYWYPLRVLDPVASAAQGQPVRLDAFVPGSRFEDVVRLSIFDKKLRMLALDALERIEMAVRVDVAHLLGKRDPVAHLKPQYLHGNFTKKVIPSGPDRGKTKHQVWIDKYQTQLNRSRSLPFVAHHLQQYGTLPVWSAIEVWDFGLLSNLFAGMQQADKDKIAVNYGATDGQTFAQWLRSLNFVRNVSAHHSRLWNLNVLELSPVPSGWPAGLNNARPFFYFSLIQHLLGVVCPHSSWGQRFRTLLIHEFPGVAHQQFSLADMGAFTGWEGWSLWPQP